MTNSPSDQLFHAWPRRKIGTFSGKTGPIIKCIGVLLHQSDCSKVASLQIIGSQGLCYQ